jgi:hypothetical protein
MVVGGIAVGAPQVGTAQIVVPAAEEPTSQADARRPILRATGDLRPLETAGEFDQSILPAQVEQPSVILVARPVVKNLAVTFVGRPVADRAEFQDPTVARRRIFCRKGPAGNEG